MSQTQPCVNTVAPLANVSMLMRAMQMAMQSGARERLLVMHGHAGYGKTTAASYAANKLRGFRVECCSHWTRKSLLQAILYEMSIPAGNSINDMFIQIVEELGKSGRPLIIDEADHLVRNSTIELVRDILDKSHAVVLLCGEEFLPKKLERWERVHSRIFDYVAAQAADIEDVEHLATLYCPEVEIDRDWLKALHTQTGGNTRRVCVNLNRARREAQHIGAISLASWGDRGWYTGTSPKPRKAV